jgi:phenolic acid decarboxylase
VEQLPLYWKEQSQIKMGRWIGSKSVNTTKMEEAVYVVKWDKSELFFFPD